LCSVPKKIYCTEKKNGQNQIWVKCRSAMQKSTLPHYFTVPNTDRTQLIPRISVSLSFFFKRTEKAKRTSSSAFKKILSAKRKLLRENVFRTLTVKITDVYETQTDNSDSSSENKRTKIYKHKTYQSMIENLKTCTTTTEIKRFLMVC
jgi:hypothetical protein